MATPESHLSTTANTYLVKEGNALADRDVVLRVWREGGMSVEPAADAARYDWFYRRNPQGEALLSLLVSGDASSPVGFLGVGFRDCYLNAERVAAGVLVDFVVHPQHRTAMPALMLQRNVRARALQSVQAVYGLPDKKAVPVFRRLGGPVQFGLADFARVLRFRMYLQRYLPAAIAAPLGLLGDTIDWLAIRLRLLFCGLTGGWVEDFDAGFDSLWERCEKQGLLIGVRNRAFLQWRFADPSGRRYRTFAVRCKRSGELRMYFICQLERKTLLVKDCLSAGSEAELVQGLLLLSKTARDAGANVVRIQISGPDGVYRALRRAQFARRGQRPFFAEVAEPLRERALAARWYITQADEDV